MDFFMIVLSVVGTAKAAPSSNSGRAVDTDYFYTVNTPNETRQWMQKDGVVIQTGKYIVQLADGCSQIVTYIADENGFRVTSDETAELETVPSSGALSVSSRSSNCDVLPNPGECRGAFPRFYFNSTTDQCDCFLYGGCDDEDPTSSWLTLEQCSANCVPALSEAGPNCRIVSESNIETSEKESKFVETPDTSNLSDAELLDLFI